MKYLYFSVAILFACSDGSQSQQSINEVTHSPLIEQAVVSYIATYPIVPLPPDSKRSPDEYKMLDVTSFIVGINNSAHGITSGSSCYDQLPEYVQVRFPDRRNTDTNSLYTIYELNKLTIRRLSEMSIDSIEILRSCKHNHDYFELQKPYINRFSALVPIATFCANDSHGPTIKYMEFLRNQTSGWQLAHQYFLSVDTCARSLIEDYPAPR